MKRVLIFSLIQLTFFFCIAQDTTAIRLALGEKDYQDYQNWIALGIGGIPHTLEGYRRVKMLGKGMKNPIDVNRFAGDIGKSGDVKTLFDLPKREGTRPTIAPFAVPHRQMDQHNDTITRNKQKQIFDEMVANPAYNLIYKTSNFEAHNPAVFLKDTLAGNATVIPKSHGEVGHIHLTDGSMHLTLSPSDAKEVIEKGWGELHGLAGDGPLIKTYMMVYSPRNDMELEVIKKILEAAVKYATHVSQ